MTGMTKQKLVKEGIYNLVPLQTGEEYYENDPDIFIDSYGKVYRIHTNGLDDPMEVVLWLQMKQSEDIASIKKVAIFLIIWFVVLPILVWFILAVSGTSLLRLLFG